MYKTIITTLSNLHPMGSDNQNNKLAEIDLDFIPQINSYIKLQKIVGILKVISVMSTIQTNRTVINILVSKVTIPPNFSGKE